MDMDLINENPTLDICLKTFLNYSSHAIQDKALPNVVDGLLPSQRRFLLSLRDLKAWSDSKTIKASMASSHTTGHYHPVGSVYQVMVNMSQEFKTQAMLTCPEGNWGEIENFQAAAERYTEIKMSRFAEEVLFGDLTKNRISSEDEEHGIVPCTVAYPGTHWEEDYLPSQLPLLLLNGSTGIAVGLAQAFQPMSFVPLLKEVMRYLREGKINYKNLSFGYPVGCEIISSQEDVIEVFKEGRGTVRAASNYKVIENRGKVVAIELTSVPPYTTLNSVGDAFNSWRLSDKKCPFVSFKNKSERNKVRLEFKFKKSDRPERGELDRIINILYKKLPIVQSMSVNMIALKDNFPVVYNIESYFKDWSEERGKIIKNVANKKYGILEIKIHKLNILMWVKENSEKIIKILKECDSVSRIDGALKKLYKGVFKLEDTKQVLGINLRQISKISEEEIRKNLENFEMELEVQGGLIESKENRTLSIISDLDYFIRNRKKFGIKDIRCEFNKELGSVVDKVQNHHVKIVSDGGVLDNFLRESGVQDILVQTGKGFFFKISTRSVRSTKYELDLPFENDKIEQACFINAEISLFITDRGKLFSIETRDIPYNIPIHFNKLIELGKVSNGEVKWVQMLPCFSKKAKYLVFCFKDSLKKIPLKDIVSFRSKIVIEKSTSAGLVEDRVNVNCLLAGVLYNSKLDISSVAERGIKRKKSPKFKFSGVFSKEVNGMSIGISSDKKGIFKLMENKD